MQINMQWSNLKSFAIARAVSIQWVMANNTYYLAAIDGAMEITAQILMDGSAASDQNDFETNYKAAGNQPILPTLTTVTTQFENNNKDLKVACFKAELPNDGITVIATASFQVPNAFGPGNGRYVLGGYAISEDYNKDDRITLFVSDPNRYIAWALALGMNPSATQPLPNSVIQGMGVLPAPFSIAMPNYPVVKNYFDDDAPSANQGWYFWPMSTGSGAVGEVEITPIAGYAFLPSGLVLNVQYIRPSGIFTGGIRVNMDWGKPGTPGSL